MSNFITLPQPPRYHPELYPKITSLISDFESWWQEHRSIVEVETSNLTIDSKLPFDYMSQILENNQNLILGVMRLTSLKMHISDQHEYFEKLEKLIQEISLCQKHYCTWQTKNQSAADYPAQYDALEAKLRKIHSI